MHPTYFTPVTKVSAAFGCLLDDTRTPVLRALLDIDRDGVLSHHIPGSSLSHLGAYPSVLTNDPGVPHELPLELASMYLGNFQAFHLMDCPIQTDDGYLHTAALLALPDFVRWFLCSHDANNEAEEFDRMIPLAISCVSTFQPWSKLANEQSDWKTRRKETMKLLAAETNLRWRLRGKTVLHFAIDNGLEVTEAMLEALDLGKDPDRHKNHIYVDKEGVEYSPDQYVGITAIEDLMEKQNLVTCLQTKGRFQPDSLASSCTLF